MHSEEISKLNKALKYCGQLKNNLEASILHVQMLNSKYNSPEALEADKLYGVLVFDDSALGTPTGRSTPTRRIQFECITPERPNRSLQDIKQINNNIIVRGIKVRRELETVMNQLKHTTTKNVYQKEASSAYKRRVASMTYSPLRSTSSPMTTNNNNCGHRCGCLSGNASPIYYKSRESLYKYSTPVNRRLLIDQNRMQAQRTC